MMNVKFKTQSLDWWFENWLIFLGDLEGNASHQKVKTTTEMNLLARNTTNYLGESLDAQPLLTYHETLQKAHERSHAEEIPCVEKKRGLLGLSSIPIRKSVGAGVQYLGMSQTRFSDFPAKNRRCLDVFCGEFGEDTPIRRTHPISAKVCLSRVSTF